MTDEKILEGLYWIRDSVSKGSSDNWQNALKALDMVIDEYLRKVETKETKMSSISAIQYGQIIEEEKTNVDTDTEQTENNK